MANLSFRQSATRLFLSCNDWLKKSARINRDIIINSGTLFNHPLTSLFILLFFFVYLCESVCLFESCANWFCVIPWEREMDCLCLATIDVGLRTAYHVKYPLKERHKSLSFWPSRSALKATTSFSSTLMRNDDKTRWSLNFLTSPWFSSKLHQTQMQTYPHSLVRYKPYHTGTNLYVLSS